MKNKIIEKSLNLICPHCGEDYNSGWENTNHGKRVYPQEDTLMYKIICNKCKKQFYYDYSEDPVFFISSDGREDQHE